MSNWVCYLIMSLDSNKTYIGSSNNQPKRLENHNNNDSNIKRKGAKYTKGQIWIPIIIISGFNDKRSCLSFEAGWKKTSKSRNNNRFLYYNQITNLNLKYTTNTVTNRFLDLLFFVSNFTYIDTKFIMNTNNKHPIFMPNYLYLNIFVHDRIEILPWPFFIKCTIINI